MSGNSTQYVVLQPFAEFATDLSTLEAKLHAIGLEREAFTITTEDDGITRLKFWEPDRVEALRILAKLDSHS